MASFIRYLNLLERNIPHSDHKQISSKSCLHNNEVVLHCSKALDQFEESFITGPIFNRFTKFPLHALTVNLLAPSRSQIYDLL